MLKRDKMNKMMKVFGIGSLCLFLLGCSKESFFIGQEESFLENVVGQETTEETAKEMVGEKSVQLPKEALKENELEADGMEERTLEEAEVLAKTTEQQTEIAVHICGAVCQPGVYVFQGRYRIYDGIQKAGGFTKEAEKDYLNLALYLEDGMKVEVPTREQVKAWQKENGAVAAGISYADDSGVIASKSKNDGRVNLNTADVTLLCTLSGIGKSRAESIIAYREEYGEFKTPEEIMKVPGIKEAAYQKIKEYIKVAE